VMSKTLFNTELAPQVAEIAAAFDTLKDGFLVRSGLQSFGMLLPLPVKSRYKAALEKIEKATKKIIGERRAKESDTGDLLSVLMAAEDLEGKPITERQLLDEIRTFLFTGHQATGIALAWAFYLLAQNSEVETRLHSEVAEVLGRRLPEAADIKRLSYISSVLKETLRLYPPGWAVGRESVQDCTIDGYFVPAGSQFVMSQWVVHRDPRFWNEAEKFKPERWREDAHKRLPRYAYFPHSGGPRFCLGSAFAEMLSIIVIAMVMQKFHLRLANNKSIEPLPSFGLIPKDGVDVTLHPVLDQPNQ
jgi:cytochrome P450